jgi:hypothetical protein
MMEMEAPPPLEGKAAGDGRGIDGPSQAL